MWGAFAESGAGDPGETGIFAERGEILCSEVSHAALESASNLAKDGIDRGRDLLKCLDTIGGGFLCAVLRVPIACSAASLHRRMAAHTPILFIELAVDLHDLARGLGTTGEEAAADDTLRKGESLHDIT